MLQTIYTATVTGIWFFATNLNIAGFCLLAGLLCCFTDALFIKSMSSTNTTAGETKVVSAAIKRIFLNIAGLSFIIYFLQTSESQFQMLLAMISGWLGSRMIGVILVGYYPHKKLSTDS